MNIKKTKILIFGVGAHGRSACRALMRLPNVELIGFIDNDQTKKNKIFLNLNVYAPSELPMLKFDKVVVVGRNIEKIRTQLLNDLNILDKKIWVMKRSEIAPSVKEKELRSNSTNKLLNRVLSIFKQHNIAYWMDASALLAIHRGIDLSSFSDVDISLINSNHANTLWEELITEEKKYVLEKVGYGGSNESDKTDNIQKIVISSKTNLALGEPACIDIHVKVLHNNAYLIPYRGNFLYTPEIHFSDYDIIQYNNMDLRIPIHSKKYLSLMYGDDWKTPAEYWGASDYGNIISK